MEWIRELLTDWEKWLNPYRNIPEKQIFTAAVLCVFLAVFVRFFRWKFRDRWLSVGLGAFYIYTVLCATFLGRISGSRRIRLEPFWCIRAAFDTGRWEYWYYIIGNILMFIPAGFFVERITGVLVKGRRRTWIKTLILGFFRMILSVGLCFLFSAFIEGAQFYFGRGLCEFDDVFHNTLGSLIGYLISLVFFHIVWYDK